MAKHKKVRSIMELQSLAFDDPFYRKVALDTALNLGGDYGDTLDNAIQWLMTNAMETDEEGVVDEINMLISMNNDESIDRVLKGEDPAKLIEAGSSYSDRTEKLDVIIAEIMDSKRFALRHNPDAKTKVVLYDSHSLDKDDNEITLPTWDIVDGETGEVWTSDDPAEIHELIQFCKEHDIGVDDRRTSKIQPKGIEGDL